MNGVDASSVCGTAAASYNGKFIHIEQKRDFRLPEDWVDAIEATWPVPESLLYFSLRKDGAVDGLPVANEDILAFDGNKFTVVFDGSAVGLSNTRINAFKVLSKTELLMSFYPAVTVPRQGSGQLNVGPTDIVKFIARTPLLGGSTSGRFEPYLDGDSVGLTQAYQQIDALAMDGDRMLISVAKTFWSGGIKIRDEDLVQRTSTRTWERYFDGSDVSLGTSGWDVKATAVADGGELYLSTRGAFTVPGLSGRNEDVFIFSPTQLGPDTSGTYSASLFFDGSSYGLTANDISALDVARSP